MTLTALHAIGSHVVVRDGEVELLRYVYEPDSPVLESPKPYLHPLRTRAGRVVSLLRPHDHIWHRGISWSLPVVGDDNFWGGPTYVRARGYVQLPNNGSQRHVGDLDIVVRAPGAVTIAHDLHWVTQAGAHIIDERRELAASLLDDSSWALTFVTRMTNVSTDPIGIGSPTTRGRANAGYGGLFWRGPRSFTGGTLVTADGAGGDELRGSRHEWMGFVGRHDEVDASSIVLMLDDVGNPRHPPQWFARSEQFAALGPAPFFSDELVVASGETLRFRYGVGIADGGAESAPSLATAVRALVAGDAPV